MVEEKKIFPSEAGHFYDPITGEPRYTVIGKNGKERPSTIRDAKKNGWLASVMTILGIISKPGLENWKMNTLLLSAATAPYDPKIIGANKWAEKVYFDYRKISSDAADFGTNIHGELELRQKIETHYWPYEKYTSPVIEEMSIRQMLVDVQTEKSFSHPIGFGGKIDGFNNSFLWDYKTKAFSKEDLESKKQLAWDEHCYQLAAYRYGLQKPHLKCLNIFISTTEPGLFHFHEWSEEELDRGLKVFLKCLELWKLIKGMNGN